jgi:hypothetical protein
MDIQNKFNTTDSIVKATIREFLERSEKGKIKYETDLDRTDLIDIEYLQHLKEELMDGILYLNKFLSILKKV